MYLAYFRVSLGNKDKNWAPRQAFATCAETLGTLRSTGKNANLNLVCQWFEGKRKTT